MTGKHLAMAAGLTIAAWLAFFGDKTPATGTAEALGHPGVPRIIAAPMPVSNGLRAVASGRGKPEAVFLELEPRQSPVDESRGAPASAGLFSSQNWTPPPPPPPKPLPPPPPSAPPLPFTYLGKKIEDKQWEIYLARGEQTFIVRDKSIIDGNYRVDGIRPPMLNLTYLPLNQSQTLAIGGAD